MDTLYALSLIGALFAGALATAIGLLRLMGRVASGSDASSHKRKAALHLSAMVATSIGSIGLALSIAVHWRWAHGPATVERWSFERFLFEHESFMVTAVLLVFGLTLNIYAERQTNRRGAV